jgi:hypothetical protein
MIGHLTVVLRMYFAPAMAPVFVNQKVDHLANEKIDHPQL